MKEKIGSSKVRNGIAKDWFVLQKELPKGVYQLIAEYVGNAIYKPSYDVKKLIVGWYTEFRNLADYYVLNETNRTFTVSGKLVGTDDSNDIIPLPNRKIGFKIRPIPTSDMHPFEQMIDATTLRSENGEAYAYTDNNGNFTFQLFVPNDIKWWRYNVLITFGGDYDFVMCTEVRTLYIGKIPTKTVLDVSPGNHINSSGAVIFKAKTYSYENLDSNGNILDTNDTVKVGNITWYSSPNGKQFTKLVSTPESLERDGIVEHRLQFDYDLGESHELYIRAVYSGSSSGIGYQTSKSNIVHLTIDDYGDSAPLIRMQLVGLDTEQKTIYFVAGEIGDKKLTLDYFDDNKPVPLGECVLTAKKE